MISKILISLVF